MAAGISRGILLGSLVGSGLAAGVLGYWGSGLNVPYTTASVCIPLAVGLAAGVSFGRHERDVALPMPAAAAIAAFAGGFLVGGVIVVIVLAAGRQIGP